MFSKTGTMGQSDIYTETLIKTPLRSRSKNLFLKIEKSDCDSLGITKYISEKYFSHDSFQYYLLANLTDSSIFIHKQRNKLVADEISRYHENSYNPISLFVLGDCSGGSSIHLKPGEIVILKQRNNQLLATGFVVRDTRMRISTSAGVLISKKYSKKIHQSDFYILPEYESMFLRGSIRNAFQK